MKIEFKAEAYMQNYTSIEDIKSGMATPLICGEGEGDYFKSQGYPLIGKTTVVIELLDKDEIARQQLEAARTELATVRAENQRRENAILDRISKLQALTFEPA